MATSATPERSEQDQGQERRRFPRYVLHRGDTTKGRYKPLFRKGNALLARTNVLDISEGGLCFSTKRGAAPRLGEMIGIEFKVPDSSQIASLGKVVRIMRRGSQIRVGVSFRDMPQQFKELLREQISQKIDEATEASESSVAHLIAVEVKPRLMPYVPVVKNVTAIVLILVALAVLFIYIKAQSQSPNWVHEAYKFVQRLKP